MPKDWKMTGGNNELVLKFTAIILAPQPLAGTQVLSPSPETVSRYQHLGSDVHCAIHWNVHLMITIL